MLASRGPTTIAFRGRTIAREMGFVRPEDITCPDLHGIKSGEMVMGEQGLVCAHKATQGGAACGALLWVVMLPAPRHESLFFYADVEYRELVDWQRERFTVEDTFRYLGVWCLRGDARRARAQRGRMA